MLRVSSGASYLTSNIRVFCLILFALNANNIPLEDMCVAIDRKPSNYCLASRNSSAVLELDAVKSGCSILRSKFSFSRHIPPPVMLRSIISLGSKAPEPIDFARAATATAGALRMSISSDAQKVVWPRLPLC